MTLSEQLCFPLWCVPDAPTHKLYTTVPEFALSLEPNLMNALRVAKTETQSDDEKLFAGLGDLEKKAAFSARVWHSPTKRFKLSTADAREYVALRLT